MKMRLQQAFSTLVNLAGGANIEAGGKSAYNNVQVGVGQRKKFVKISFLSHSLLFADITYRYNFKVTYEYWLINFKVNTKRPLETKCSNDLLLLYKIKCMICI